jgi:hypothetical protein
MQVLIDIEDNKADFVLDWLNQHSYIKIKSIKDKKAAKAQFLEELKESVDFINEVKKGKAEGIPAKELLDELL